MTLFTRREAALYLRVSVSWLARGGGPPAIHMGEIVRYDVRDLDAYLQACKAPILWPSTNSRLQTSGGASTKSTASVTASRPASEIDARLKSKSEAYAAKHGLDRAPPAGLQPWHIPR